MNILRSFRFVAGIVIASLAGAVIVGALFANTPLSDWVGLFSSPLDVCGYHRSPDEFPCLARLFTWLAVRTMAISFVFWPVIYLVLLKVRMSRIPVLLLSGAVVGTLGGVILRVFWVQFVTGDFKMSLFLSILVPPYNPWSGATGALISGGFGVAMVGVFRVIVGAQPRLDAKDGQVG